MIDISKTIKHLMEEGYSITVCAPVTLLTDDPEPLYIGALDAHVFHKNLKRPDHDAKPWKMASGKEKRSAAQAESEMTLANAAVSGDMLKGIMADHTTI